MEKDIEENHTLVDESEPKSTIIKVCSIDFRIQKEPLTLRSFIKLICTIISLEFIIGIGIFFMRASIPDVRFLRGYPLIATMFICVLYILMYTNLIMNGWGAQDGRFWCDVKIMYVRGFNTIRTVTKIGSNVFLLIFLAILLGHTSWLTSLLILGLYIIIEWQTGIAENLNQIDIKAFDKFVESNGILQLEQLQYYQLQRTIENIQWTPFIVSFVLRLYLMSCICITSTFETEWLVFQIPIIILIVIYIGILPSMIDFAYYKGMYTFCQIEIFRSLSDVLFPVLIMAFALV